MTHEKYGYNSKSQLIMDLMSANELNELLAELIQLDETGFIHEVINDLTENLED